MHGQNVTTRVRRTLLLVLGCAALTTGSAQADLVISDVWGSALEGGNVTVGFTQSGFVSAPIEIGAFMQGVASAPGFFEFSVTGDTFLNVWELGNLSADPNDFIEVIIFDLTSSVSVFDDDSLPSTPGSSFGQLGAAWVSGPIPLVSTEINLWDGMKNTGDLYKGELIAFAVGGDDAFIFEPGEVFRWMDDTDVVPGPSALLIASLGCLGLGRRRRRISACG